jgi:hypothetical protein
MNYTFDSIDGVILSSQRFYKTQIQSSGGGGYISSDYGGYVSAPTIYSTINSRQEIFIKALNNKEQQIVIHNVELPLREGQEVSFLLVQNDRYFCWVSAINRNTNTRTMIIEDTTLMDLKILSAPLKIKKGAGLYIYLGWVAYWIMFSKSSSAVNSNIFSGLLGIAFMLVVLYWIYNRTILKSVNLMIKNRFYKNFEEYYDEIK